MMKEEAREVAWKKQGITMWRPPTPKELREVADTAFDAGYEARDAMTCEWEFKWVDRFNEPIYGPACDIEWSYERSTFCPNCGGRVVVKEAK